MNARQLQTLYLVAAGVLFVVALSFVFGEDRFDKVPNSIAPNMFAGLAACGFALAGGMSLIASAMVTRQPQDDSRTRSKADTVELSR